MDKSNKGPAFTPESPSYVQYNRIRLKCALRYEFLKLDWTKKEVYITLGVDGIKGDKGFLSQSLSNSQLKLLKQTLCRSKGESGNKHKAAQSSYISLSLLLFQNKLL